MRNGETHFEQVPIDVALTVLRQATALAEELEKAPAPALPPERKTSEESLKQQESNPSKGQP